MKKIKSWVIFFFFLPFVIYSPSLIFAQSVQVAVPQVASYVLATNSGANGTISPSNPSVTLGASQTFTITANQYYNISSVSVDGTTIASANPVTLSDGAVAVLSGTQLTLTGIEAVHTISAAFAIVPTVTSFSPTGVLPFTMGGVTLSVTTNENMVCKYLETSSPPPSGIATSGPSYASMPNTFQTTGGTVHTQSFSAMSAVGTNQYYNVKCEDQSGNITPTDTVITVTVTPPPAPSAPTLTVNLSPDKKYAILIWNASTEAVSGVPVMYKIYKAQQVPSVGLDTTFTTVMATSSTHWTDPSPIAGNIYQYYVTAFAALPTTPTSNPSNTVNVTNGNEGVVINGGASSTTSDSIILSLQAYDQGNPMQSNGNMKFSSDNVTWTNPQPFATTIPWLMGDGNGPKTVYTMFQDSLGNWSSVYSASIFVGDPTLVANYLFNFDLTDASGYGNNGRLRGGLAFSSAASSNYYAQFNGTDSYAHVPSTALLNLNANTVSFWVKPNYYNYANETYPIITKGEGATTEYSLQLYGQAQGLTVIPPTSTPSTPVLSGPTNLVIQDGSISPTTGSRILYLSWQDNAGSNASGYAIEICNPVSCQTPITLPAHTSSYTARLDPSKTLLTISVAATNPGSFSVPATDNVNLSVKPIQVTPTYNTPKGYLPMDNSWHQVTRTWNPSGVTFYYIDGNLAGQGTTTFGPQGDASLLIGASNKSKVLPQSVVTTTIPGDGTATVTWTSIAGKKYEVQYSLNNGQTWFTLGSALTATDVTSYVTDASYQSGNLYQVVQIPELVYNGDLNDMSIYNRVLTGPQVLQLYQEEITNTMGGVNPDYVNYLSAYQTLTGTQLTNAISDLNNLSQRYASVFSPNGSGNQNTNFDEITAYEQRNFEDTVQFFIDELTLLEKYQLLESQFNTSLSAILPNYEAEWQSEEQCEFAGVCPGVALSAATGNVAVANVTSSASSKVAGANVTSPGASTVSLGKSQRVSITKDQQAALRQVNELRLLFDPKKYIDVMNHPEKINDYVSSFKPASSKHIKHFISASNALRVGSKALTVASNALTGASNTSTGTANSLTSNVSAVTAQAAGSPSDAAAPSCSDISPYCNKGVSINRQTYYGPDLIAFGYPDSGVSAWVEGTEVTEVYAADAGGNCDLSNFIVTAHLKDFHAIPATTQPGLHTDLNDYSVDIFAGAARINSSSDVYSTWVEASCAASHSTYENFKNVSSGVPSIPVESNAGVDTTDDYLGRTVEFWDDNFQVGDNFNYPIFKPWNPNLIVPPNGMITIDSVSTDFLGVGPTVVDIENYKDGVGRAMTAYVNQFPTFSLAGGYWVYVSSGLSKKDFLELRVGSVPDPNYVLVTAGVYDDLLGQKGVSVLKVSVTMKWVDVINLLTGN